MSLLGCSRGVILFRACVAVGAFMAGSSAVRAPAQASGQKPRLETAWGKPVHGIQAGIRLVGGSEGTKPSRAVEVQFILRNTTKQPISFAYGNAQRIYGWEVARGHDGVWAVEPRWRHWREETLEGVVAGALEFSIPAEGELPLPLDGPRLLVSQGAANDHLTIKAKEGERVRLKGVPITAAAKGEEWLDKLTTGILTL